MSQKSSIEEVARFQAPTDRFNSALARIQLLDDGDVYATARRVDACLTALTREARSAQAERDRWRARRAGLSGLVAE